MDSYKTPLRYPGGKRALYRFVAQIIRCNGICDGYYVEPFAGGSGLAIELLLREYVGHIYLNDADPHIFAFWRALLLETEALVRKIDTVQVTVEEWGRQKHIFNNIKDHSELEVAFATFFLNRCNRSGILGGRPIGGLDQTGPWKIDARFNRKNLIRRIEMIALYKERIHAHGCDATVFLKNVAQGLAPAKTLIYLDPPYYRMGGELYLNNYTHSDHVSLSSFIKALPFKWILSYDDVPQIREMYNDKRSLDVGFYYRANDRREGKELMFLCDDLDLPFQTYPSKIETRPPTMYRKIK